jgi:hypothetical protein
MKNISGSKSSPQRCRCSDVPPTHTRPKCSTVLAAVKDKPFGRRSAPSLTAAARRGAGATMLRRKGPASGKRELRTVR